MQNKLFFIFTFSLVTLAQKIEPPPIENGDEFSYQIVLGDLEYYLRHKINGVKECYNKVKPDYYKVLNEFGWELYDILEDGVFVNLGKKNSQKQNIKNAIDCLRKEIAAFLRDNYLNPLWTKIQALHFDDAAILLDRHRDSVRGNMEEYKKLMNQLKKDNKQVYNAVEGRLRGSRSNIMLWTEGVAKNLTTCMENVDCRLSSSKEA